MTNPRFEQVVRSSFAAQQHGFLHAGVLAAALDSACGYAALSLMPEVLPC